MATDAIAQSEQQDNVGTALDDKLDLDLGDIPVPSVKKLGLQVEAGSFYDEEPPDMGGAIGEDPIGEYSGLRFSLPLKE